MIVPIRVKLVEINKPDNNGIVYDRIAVDKIVSSFNKMTNYGLLGEFDPDPEYSYTISLKNVSHIINDIWINEDETFLIGKIRLIGVDNKKFLIEGLKRCSVYFRPRCTGIITESNILVIKKFFTVDAILKNKKY